MNDPTAAMVFILFSPIYKSKVDNVTPPAKSHLRRTKYQQEERRAVR
jgi:hypothetical protein